jgi:hypothetical protein
MKNIEQRYDKEPNGCISCTFEGCTREVEDGGYLQGGYTYQDEYGKCPDEANV